MQRRARDDLVSKSDARWFSTQARTDAPSCSTYASLSVLISQAGEDDAADRAAPPDRAEDDPKPESLPCEVDAESVGQGAES